MLDILADFYKSTGVTELFRFDTELFGVMIPGKLIMVVIALIFIYLAVKKGYEPYLLIPIAFGMLLANLPLAGLMDGPLGNQPGGLLYYLYQGTTRFASFGLITKKKTRNPIPDRTIKSANCNATEAPRNDATSETIAPKINQMETRFSVASSAITAIAMTIPQKSRSDIPRIV
jgi:hypothetical protein